MINTVCKVTGVQRKEVETELKNPEHYQEETALNQDFSFKAQDIYDKAVNKITGKENTNDITTDLNQAENRPSKETDALSQRLEKLKEKQAHVPKQGKTTQKIKQKVDRDMER